jgi:hypothetical protein
LFEYPDISPDYFLFECYYSIIDHIILILFYNLKSI